MTAVYSIIIGIILILNLIISVSLFLLKSKPEMFKIGKVIDVNNEGSVLEVNIKGEIKKCKLDMLYPIGTEIGVFYFDDGSDEVIYGVKHIIHGLPESTLVGTVICGFYLACLAMGITSGFGSFMAIIMAAIMCFCYGMASILEDTCSNANSVELEIEYDSEIKLENSETELFSPVFKYVEGEETKYLKGFKYCSAEELETYKGAPIKVRYNDICKKITLVSKFKKIKVFKIFAIICIILTAIAPLIL